MEIYTIKNENNEIQVLDTMGIESLKAITEAVDKLDITEEQKQAIFIQNKIFQVKEPENFFIAHTTTVKPIETSKGIFYILGKTESLSVENNQGDKIYTAVKNSGEVIIKGEPISFEEINNQLKWSAKLK